MLPTVENRSARCIRSVEHEITSMKRCISLMVISGACFFGLSLVFVLREVVDAPLVLETESDSRTFRLPIHQHRSGEEKLLFVHVGKTGGTTVEDFLEKNEIRHMTMHTKPLSSEICKLKRILKPRRKCGWMERRWKTNTDKVVVSVRDPIARVISAFNWRHTDGGGVKDKSFSLKHYPEAYYFDINLYKCFPSINDFAEALGPEYSGNSSTKCRSIARDALDLNSTFYGPHLMQGYRFYMGPEILDYFNIQNRSIYVVHQETMEADLMGLSDFLHVKLKHPRISQRRSAYKRKNDKYISEQGKVNLRKALQPEYDFLEQLEDSSVNRIQLPSAE